MSSIQQAQSVPKIKVEVVNRLAWVKLNRPHKANALNSEMLETLLTEITAVSQRPDVHGVVLHAAGVRVFSAGADVNEPQSMSDIALWNRVSEVLWAMPVLSVALINGACIGGGLTVALGCDIRVAVPEARFEYPVLRNDIMPCDNDILGLRALVGRSRTDQLVLTGLSVDAYTALQWGLVDRIVHLERLEDTAREICEIATSVERAQVERQKTNLWRFRRSVQH